MKWCKAMNMWCSDMDEEDVENTGCDGNCNGCDECEDVKFQFSQMRFRKPHKKTMQMPSTFFMFFWD